MRIRSDLDYSEDDLPAYENIEACGRNIKNIRTFDIAIKESNLHHSISFHFKEFSRDQWIHARLFKNAFIIRFLGVFAFCDKGKPGNPISRSVWERHLLNYTKAQRKIHCKILPTGRRELWCELWRPFKSEGKSLNREVKLRHSKQFHPLVHTVNRSIKKLNFTIWTMIIYFVRRIIWPGEQSFWRTGLAMFLFKQPE